MDTVFLTFVNHGMFCLHPYSIATKCNRPLEPLRRMEAFDTAVKSRTSEPRLNIMNMKILFFTLLLACFSGLTASVERPNILWITSEDNSASWIGCYGNESADTPNIDKLAEEGFQYMHAYVNAPVCAAQRSTWITGILSLSMGTHAHRSFYKIPHDKIRLYPDYLNENGYYTGNCKKRDYNFGGRSTTECWDNPKSVDWKALQTQQPFFQVINLGDSHESRAFGDINNTKHNPADVALPSYHPDVPDIRKNYALYYDAIQTMDQQVGDALKKLEESGLAEETIVVYCSDHGGVLPRSKRFLFKSGLHCPLVIRIPEKYKYLWPADQPGNKVDRLVSFVDMPKTWLSITGSTVPDTMQGTIFLGSQSEPEPEYHFSFRGRTDERIDNARAISDKRFLYIRSYTPYVPWVQELNYQWKMKASQAWVKAIEDGSASEVQARFLAPKQWTEELYDMENDPDNVSNLFDSPEHSRVLKEMRMRLRQRQEQFYDAGLIPETERARLADKNNTTIYEMVRNPALYNVSELLDAADLAMAEDPNNLAKLRELIDHEHVGMRYWGIVGCFLLNDKESGLKAIADESHEVRAMAAWLLIRAGEKEKGLACLNELIESRSYALLPVLNIAGWMGEDARPLVVALSKMVYEEKWKKQWAFEVRMRDMLLKRFGAPVGIGDSLFQE